MEYDEIDDYVNQLFDKGPNGNGTKGNGLNGDVISGDWRIDRIDEVIQDTYNEALWWHNNRISEGGDPRSGLRGLPYVPWDENIDGVAAMQGAIGGYDEKPWLRNGAAQATVYSEPEGGGGFLIAVLVFVLMSLCVWMACYGSGMSGEIMRLR